MKEFWAASILLRKNWEGTSLTLMLIAAVAVRTRFEPRLLSPELNI
jgi:hypothetical protein